MKYAVYIFYVHNFIPIYYDRVNKSKVFFNKKYIINNIQKYFLYKELYLKFFKDIC